MESNITYPETLRNVASPTPSIVLGFATVRLTTAAFSQAAKSITL